MHGRLLRFDRFNSKWREVSRGNIVVVSGSLLAVGPVAVSLGNRPLGRRLLTPCMMTWGTGHDTFALKFDTVEEANAFKGRINCTRCAL